MRLKSFHAASMPEAIAMVRKALGEEAIIVATREEKGGGGVRVTAAIEDAPEPQISEQTEQVARASVEPRVKQPKARKPEEADSSEPDAPRTPPGRRAGDSADVVHQRAEERRVSVESQIEAALDRHGVISPVRERIAAAAHRRNDSEAVIRLTHAIRSVFNFDAIPETSRITRPVALVGPPGMGKTLAISKLAAAAVMNGVTPAVITTDTIRAGGIEQLEAFTRILGLNLRTAEDSLMLADAVEQSQAEGAGMVLIDTAGRNPFLDEDMDELSELISLIDIEPVLTLAAGGDAEEAEEIGAIFTSLGVRRMLASRLDMTRRLGGMFAAVGNNGLSFSNVSNTSKVADGLPGLTPGLLARLLLARPARRRAGRATPPTFSGGQ
ncbi:MAG: AAA family ATPase [Alphaproteobacteria bacterium]